MLRRFRKSLSERRPAPSLSSRLAMLSPQERLFVVVVLVCAFIPPVLSTFAEWGDPEGVTLAGRLGRHSVVLWLVALGVVAVVLLAIEPPRVLSLRAYASQLRARYRQLQFTHAAAQLRLAQEQSHHDEQLPPQP